MNKYLIRTWLTICMLFASGVALAAFDPVNDDTDIFLANPTIAAERPNVLIILDNTANWTQPFVNEKAALVSVINGLDDRYNVGLMLFNQNQAARTNPLDNGAFVAFHIRQMTATNKAALASMVGNFLDNSYSTGGQKADANPIGMAMYEAYLYYAGLSSRTGWNQLWADFPSNTYAAGQTSYTNALTGHAFSVAPTSATTYSSPITDGCQKNFIIYISNGDAHEAANLRTELQGYLATLTHSTTPNTILISPNGQQGNWADEMAQYMHDADVNSSIVGKQTVTTYTVDIDPTGPGHSADGIALLTSMATHSGGKYFGVTSGNSGTAIVDALNKIFSEVQAVNSVFASTTLPVSVNVRGTNINQVYIGVFRPDAQKSPRWLGNLKLYDLALTSGVIYLADATGAHAEDPTTGFITPTATSFWTSSALTPTNFWSYRSADVNGSGGASDAPDGDLVEKGGVAQQIRHYYEASQATRNLYTCTIGGALPDCVPCTRAGSIPSQTCASGSALSATPFNTTNTAISVAALNLNTQSVATLSGKRSVSLIGLTDRKTATLARSLAAGASATPTLISSGSGATTRTVTGLTTAASIAITNITSGSSGTYSTTTGVLRWTFTLTKKSGNNVTWNISTGATPTAPAGQTFTNTPTITSAVSGNVTIASMSGTCTQLSTPTINVSSAVPAGTGPNASASGSANWTVNSTGANFNQTNPAQVCTVTLDLASTYSYTAVTTSATATVTTATPHGYLSGQSVTTSGLSNTAFNCTSAGITVVSATSFTCSIAAAQYSSGTPAITGNVSGNSQIITVTTSAANGYAAGSSVIITGASPTGYNGTYTVLTNTSSLTVGQNATANFAAVTGWPTHNSAGTTFKLLKAGNAYASLLTPNTASYVYTVGTGVAATGTLTITAAGNTFLAGNVVTLTGAAVSAYNVTCTVLAAGNPFTCNNINGVGATLGPLPDDSSGTATAVSGATYNNTITATVTAHGFVNNDQVMVESVGGADANFTASPGPYAITWIDANTFSFTTAFAGVQVAPTGSFRVRLGGANNPKAYVTATAHGFATGNTVTVAGAVPAAYNGSFSVTVLDANNFTYTLPGVTPEVAATYGTATTLGTASINTTTATAQANNHGFTNGASISISGASPAAFNGTFTITVTDANHFTYTLPSAEGDATGTIVAVAASAGASLRDDIINWVRGRDNTEDEDMDALATDVRASVHGDVLHSRPAVVNYNRFGGDNDVYIFYGANDSVFHAVKGGMATDAGDTSGLTPGQEAWGFVMSESFDKLQRLRNNSPAISSYNKKPYFADGPIGVYTKDAGGNGRLGDSGDTVNLYIGMRRGGRAIYALDVNNPASPKLLWKIDNTHTSSSTTSTSERFKELGQTWSEPKVVENINGYSCPNNIATAANCTGNPVLIFGGGYDPTVEDIDPSTITSSTANTVTTAAGTFTRSMGRAIYVVDAITGRRVVSIGGQYSYGDTDHGLSYTQPDKIVAGMDCAIASDFTVVKNLSGGAINRAYVGDTCGNLWRLDFGNTYDSSDAASRSSWVTVTKIASIGGTANADRRKFFYPPDVVAGTGTSGFDSVLIGSGDREHPFDTTVVNRMYMFKDRGGDSGPYTGLSAGAISATGGNRITYPVSPATDFNPDYPTILGSAVVNTTSNNWLYDATNNCLQQACPPGTTMTAAALATQIAAEKALLSAANGWYVTLSAGEKVVGNAVALAGTVFFNTNQPSAAAGGGNCGSNLGFARQYQVSVADATAVANLDTSNAALNIADRSSLHAGGGYLPSPVHVVVQLTDTVTGQTEIKEAVISGTEVMSPGSTPLMTRFRKYWYKEIDQ